MAKKKLYVVVRGRRPGVYGAWSGPDGAAQQVHGFSDALFRGFARPEYALRWLDRLDEKDLPADRRLALMDSIETRQPGDSVPNVDRLSDGDKVVIYTDGGAIGNPGPGGYGAVLIFPDHREELSGGFRRTTNNRMELMACIAALEALKAPGTGVPPTPVVLYSDSRYVVDGISEGWADRWRRRGWRRATGEIAENVDLWSRLLTLCQELDVTFRWLKGHAGHPGNERADELATAAAQRPSLPPDTDFEAGTTQTRNPRLF